MVISPLESCVVDLHGFAFLIVIAAAILNHGIGTAGTGIMTIPSKLGLIKPEGKMLDGMCHQLFPIQVLDLLPDDEEDFSQLMVCDGLQVNFFGNGFEQVVVGKTEGWYFGIDAKFIGSWMGFKHDGLL
jgi:hypothetical protein